MNTKNWFNTKELIELTAMLKSLGHSSRISIMYLLCNNTEKRMTVKTIYELLKMPQPVISRHLGILRNSGLITRLMEGNHIYYKLNEKNALVRKIANCFSSLDKA